MEDIFSVIKNVITWLFSRLIVDFIIEIILYWYGRICLFVFTFNQFPKKNSKYDEPETFEIAGALFFIVPIIAFIIFDIQTSK